MNDKLKAVQLVKTTNPMTPEALKQAEELGMIPKCDLEPYAFYKGYCSNAWIAMWDERLGVFIHLRTKFGSTFAEKINHPEDDNGFDVFVPLEKIERLNFDD